MYPSNGATRRPSTQCDVFAQRRGADADRTDDPWSQVHRHHDGLRPAVRRHRGRRLLPGVGPQRTPWPRSRAASMARTQLRHRTAASSWPSSMPCMLPTLNDVQRVRVQALRAGILATFASDRHNQKPVDICAKPCYTVRAQGKAGEGSGLPAAGSRFLSSLFCISRSCVARKSRARA
jgi:hypothetical protein